MKNMFDKLKNRNKLLLISMVGLLNITFIILTALIDTLYLKLIFATVLLILLIMFLFLAIWYALYQHKFNYNNKYDCEDTLIERIVEYPKVYKNHFLKYVFVEKLTLSNNLDKLTGDEENFIYVDDVENKYDEDALLLIYNNYKLGYFYKNGKFRDLYRSLKNDHDYLIITRIIKLDLTKNEIKLKIAFYKYLNSENFKTVDVSIDNNNYDYLKINYWLDVNKIVKPDNKIIYQVCDIYGKELGTFEDVSLDGLNDKMYAKIIGINDFIHLKIYVINK